MFDEIINRINVKIFKEQSFMKYNVDIARGHTGMKFTKLKNFLDCFKSEDFRANYVLLNFSSMNNITRVATHIR